MNLMTYHQLTSGEFEDLVKKHFPIPDSYRSTISQYGDLYSFVSEQEGSNGAAYIFMGVRGKDHHGYPEKECEAFISGKTKSWPSPYCLFSYFAHKKIIPDGDYLVTVYW